MLPAISDNAAQRKNNKTRIQPPRRGRHGVLWRPGTGRQNATDSEFYQAVLPLPRITDKAADKAVTTEAELLEKELSRLVGASSASAGDASLSGVQCAKCKNVMLHDSKFCRMCGHKKGCPVNSEPLDGGSQAPPLVSLPRLSSREASRGGRDPLDTVRQGCESSLTMDDSEISPAISPTPGLPQSKSRCESSLTRDGSLISPTISPTPTMGKSYRLSKDRCESTLTWDDSVLSSTISPTPTLGNALSLGKRKERRHVEMSDVQRQVRGNGLEPGYWNAGAFSAARQRLLSEGKLDAMPALTNMAAQVSELALEAGMYRLPTPAICEVQIPPGGHIQFHGLDSMEPPAVARGSAMAPPLICSSLRTLEAARTLIDMYPEHVIAASFDATGFSKDGKRLLGAQKAQSAAQQEMFIRTNLEYHLRTAQVWCGEMRMQEQLTAMTDPLALAASDVQIFRGPVEEGYRFFPSEECASMNLLVTARSKVRPLMADHGEYFANQDDYLCCVDRLNLIARGAIAQGVLDHVANNGGKRHDVDKVLAENRKPVLVVGMQDLTVAAAQQPRQSIAMALKGWRLQWAHFFEAVVVACGDNDTATIMDKTVNGNIYAEALAGKKKDEGWHWDERLLKLSVNNVLSNIQRGILQRQSLVLQAPLTIETKVSDHQETTAEPLSPKSSKRLKPGQKLRGTQADATLPDEPLSPKSTRSTRKFGRLRGTEASLRGEASIVHAHSRSSVAMAQELSGLVTDHNSAHHIDILASEKKQKVWSKSNIIKTPAHNELKIPLAPSQEDSRATWERCLKLRQMDSHLHNKLHYQSKRFDYQNPDEMEAKAAEKRILAVKCFAKLGADKEHQKNQEEWLDKTAETLDMPEEVKNAIAKEVVTAQMRLQAIDHEKSVFESVQNMAFNLDRHLQKQREVQRLKEAMTQMKVPHEHEKMRHLFKNVNKYEK